MRISELGVNEDGVKRKKREENRSSPKRHNAENARYSWRAGRTMGCQLM